jgi:hypothetical protein
MHCGKWYFFIKRLGEIIRIWSFGHPKNMAYYDSFGSKKGDIKNV